MIELHAVQFRNNWMKTILKKIEKVVRPSLISLTEEFFNPIITRFD